jgi:hypothetical protein
VHIVRFDSQAQIQQIRVYWDQGSLLKQVEVIGSRGRNWPIRDAKDQSKLITNAIAAVGNAAAPVAQSSAQPQPQPQQQEQPAAARSARSASPAKRHIKDPHSSLSLFGGDEDDEPRPAVIAPYAPSSTRPPVRDHDILNGGYDEDAPINPRESVISPRAGANKHFGPIRVFGDESDEPVTSAVQPRIGSSRNFQAIRVFDTEDESTQDEQQAHRGHVQPKAGSHKNYQPNNLFGEGDAPEEEQEARYKTHPKKFTHFDMANEENDVPERPARKFRPMSQWDFADFATPEKPRGKVLPQDVRHFSWSDNEEEAAETPPARPRVVQPRRDADTHFSLTDDDGVRDNKRIIGGAHNKGLGLYENNLYDEQGNPTPVKGKKEEEPKQQQHRHQQSIGVVDNTSRKKDFDSHWAITDSAPSDEPAQQKTESSKPPISSDRMKAVKMMDASWDRYEEESPEPKKNGPIPSIKRSTFQPSWGFGDDE